MEGTNEREYKLEMLREKREDLIVLKEIQELESEKEQERV